MAGAGAPERADAAALPPGCVVDLGAGTGHYLARVLAELRRARSASRSTARSTRCAAPPAPTAIGAVGCDIWRGLPLGDGAAALMLNVFAPRNGAEIRRVLQPGGTLIVVTPTPRHLGELVDAPGSCTSTSASRSGSTTSSRPHLTLLDQRTLEWDAAP